MDITISYVKSSVQSALLGAVTSNLRAVTVTILEGKLILYFYYENEPTENEIDLSQVASTEVVSDFSNIVIGEEQIVLSQPKPIPLKDGELIIYHRYEGHPIEKMKNLYKDITGLSVIMASQFALLGMVTTNLRAVSITFVEKDLTLYFYYDEEPTNEELHLSEAVLQDVVSSLEGSTGKLKRFVIPEPERIPLKDDGFWVYFRYEEYLADD